MDSATNDSSATIVGREISGRWVVIAMFVFGVTITGMVSLYWHLHTKPFRPLQEVLAREFERSHPLVQGGQEKMYQTSPLLRITLRVDFDPNDENNNDRLEKLVDRIAQLADEHHGLAKYDTLEIHLVRLRSEQATQQREIELDVPTILERQSTK